jgi:hypothetical protein
MNFPGLHCRPAPSVAAGSAIVVLVNFSAARGMLFRRSRMAMQVIDFQ